MDSLVGRQVIANRNDNSFQKRNFNEAKIKKKTHFKNEVGKLL